MTAYSPGMVDSIWLNSSVTAMSAFCAKATNCRWHYLYSLITPPETEHCAPPMTATQLLIQIQSIFSLSAEDMVRICEHGDAKVAASQFDNAANDADWCSEELAIQFLNGFIVECRGASDKPPPIESQLTNNLIFRKIKIALGLQADDLLQMLADVEVVLSKHELSALFRKTDNKHYRPCSDELLEAFLASVRVNHYG